MDDKKETEKKQDAAKQLFSGRCPFEQVEKFTLPELFDVAEEKNQEATPIPSGCPFETEEK